MQPLKQSLRKQLLKERSEISEKDKKDELIFQNLMSLEAYKKARCVLCYVSSKDEADTIAVINQALKYEKTVAVPYCEDDIGNMSFYIINSLDELKNGRYSIPEPDINTAQKLNDFSNSIIIVPALCYDKKGFRIGYGRGYYDRFLEKHPLFSIGLCYNSLMQDALPVNEHDKRVDIIVTDKDIIHLNSEDKNG